jgi:hypothetical protein
MPNSAWAGCQPLILRGEQSGLWTHIATVADNTAGAEAAMIFAGPDLVKVYRNAPNLYELSVTREPFG